MVITARENIKQSDSDSVQIPLFPFQMSLRKACILVCCIGLMGFQNEVQTHVKVSTVEEIVSVPLKM